jgi:HTH-type transcriptional regulator, sugar sensing transcriptional regulator
MDTISHLVHAGLTKGEAKVYLALLEIGQCSVTPLVARSRVSLSKVYDILSRLEDKGLVSHAIIRGVRHFKAAPPDNLLSSLKSKQAQLEQHISSFVKLLPELQAKQKLKENKEEAEIYIGMEGIATIFNQETEWMKRAKGTSYVIGATKGGKAGKQVDDFFRRLQARRNHFKLRTKFVFNKNMKGRLPYLEKSSFCDIRYIDTGSEMTSINIFADKTVIAVYSTRPFLFVITSKSAARDFRSYFDSLWKEAKK